MGAPFGNQHRAKSKRWEAALERAIIRKATGALPPEDRSDLIKGLDMAADEFVAAMFEKKDLPFFKEWGDRFDGKSVQSTELTGADGGPVQVSTVKRIVVGA